MNDYCLHIEKHSDNVCNMASCIRSVEGKASNSASPTDTWVVGFDNGAMYEDIPITTGFVKIWVNPRSARDFIANEEGYDITKDNLEYSMTYLEGLEYEVKVYRDVIRPLIDNQRCPNFVRYLGMGRRCTFDSLLNMLSSRDGKDYDNFRMALCRNLMYCIKKIPDRPAIDDFEDVMDNVDNVQEMLGKLRFDFVMTKTVEEGSQTLLDHIMDNGSYIGFDVILQILMACEAMRMVEMAHNDLHYGNIWLSPIDEHLVTYKIGEKVYTFMTNYKVMVYDFDRSYVRKLRKNKMLSDDKDVNKDGFFCTNGGACNKYVPGRDAMKIFWYLLPRISEDNPLDIDFLHHRSKALLNILAPKKHQAIIKHIYNIGPHLLDNNEMPIPDEMYGRVLHPIQTMIDECYSHIDEGYDPTDDKNSVFVMS